MSDYISEKYQLGIVAHFLREKGIKFTTEASIYSTRIDILGIQRDTTLAIELKSQDVGRGIRQAKRNCLLVNYSFLSMWANDITNETIDRVADSPIGLLSIDDGVKCLSPPTKCDSNVHAKRRARNSVFNDI